MASVLGFLHSVDALNPGRGRARDEFKLPKMTKERRTSHISTHNRGHINSNRGWGCGGSGGFKRRRESNVTTGFELSDSDDFTTRRRRRPTRKRPKPLVKRHTASTSASAAAPVVPLTQSQSVNMIAEPEEEKKEEENPQPLSPLAEQPPSEDALPIHTTTTTTKPVENPRPKKRRRHRPRRHRGKPKAGPTTQTDKRTLSPGPATESSAPRASPTRVPHSSEEEGAADRINDALSSMGIVPVAAPQPAPAGEKDEADSVDMVLTSDDEDDPMLAGISDAEHANMVAESDEDFMSAAPGTEPPPQQPPVQPAPAPTLQQTAVPDHGGGGTTINNTTIINGPVDAPEVVFKKYDDFMGFNDMENSDEVRARVKRCLKARVRESRDRNSIFEHEPEDSDDGSDVDPSQKLYNDDKAGRLRASQFTPSYNRRGGFKRIKHRIGTFSVLTNDEGVAMNGGMTDAEETTQDGFHVEEMDDDGVEGRDAFDASDSHHDCDGHGEEQEEKVNTSLLEKSKMATMCAGCLALTPIRNHVLQSICTDIRKMAGSMTVEVMISILDQRYNEDVLQPLIDEGIPIMIMTPQKWYEHFKYHNQDPLFRVWSSLEENDKLLRKIKDQVVRVETTTVQGKDGQQATVQTEVVDEEKFAFMMKVQKHQLSLLSQKTDKMLFSNKEMHDANIGASIVSTLRPVIMEADQVGEKDIEDEADHVRLDAERLAYETL